MNKSRWIWGIIVGCLTLGDVCAQSTSAILYSPETAETKDAIKNKTPTPPQTQTIASPKFIDFDSLDFNEPDWGMLPETGPQSLSEKSPTTIENMENSNKSAPLPDVVPTKAEPQTKTNSKQEQDSQSSNMKEKSLTDVLQNKANIVSEEEPEVKEDKNKEEEPDTKEAEQKNEKEENWSEGLKNTLKKIGADIGNDSSKDVATLEELTEDSQNVYARSNAAVFDIAGVMLRMNKEEVEDNLRKRGYQKVKDTFDIPNFIRWRNEEKCRNNGVVGYERLENCIVTMAKKNNYQYLSLARYMKYKTQEEITVNFTSNFSGNKVYKISYKSMSTSLKGSSPKAIYLRNIKIYDFWKQVNRKYGAPDNKENATWGLGNKKPYLQAGTGMLVLEDPMLRELDFSRMSQEDQRFLNTGLYTF